MDKKETIDNRKRAWTNCHYSFQVCGDLTVIMTDAHAPERYIMPSDEGIIIPES